MRYFLILLIAVTPFSQAVTFAELQQRFISQEFVRAEFSQSKIVKDFAKPLKSSGIMLIAKNNGVIWQQQKPFAMLMVLNNDRMVQSINQQPPQVITAESNPQMFQFNHLLRGLFQADEKVLKEYFSLKFISELDSWSLTLTPIATPLDKIFSTIHLSGHEFLEQIQLFDKQGDLTEILLSQQQLTPTYLTPAEKQFFELH